MSTFPNNPLKRKPGKAKRQRAAESQEQIRQEIAEVKEVLLSLERLDKSTMLYPSGSAVLRQHLDDLHNRLAVFLGRVQALEVSIAADEIEYEGEVVYDATKSGDRQNIAFTLEDGGIRRLVFLIGLEKAELQGFCEALKLSRQPDAEELPTLLWLHGLRHVSYLTVNFHTDAAEAPIEDLLSQSTRLTIVDRLKNRELGIDQIAMVRSDRPPDQEEKEYPEIFALSATETADVQRRIAEFQGDSGLSPYCRVILSLLLADRSEDGARVHLSSLQGALESLMDEGRVAEAADILMSVRRLAESTPSYGHPRPMVVALRGFVAASAKKELGQRMAEHLSRGRTDMRAVLAYVRALGKHAIYVASELLGGSQDQRLVAAIAEGCREDYAHLRDFVADPNPRLAAVAVRILAEVAGDGGRVDFIRASMHADPVVRREGFIGLARCKDVRALDRLLAAFDDADPEIRTSAMRAFSSQLLRPRPELYVRMLDLVEDRKAFERRPRVEQEQLFGILGKVDPEKGVPLLEHKIKRWAFFRRAQARQQRLAAAGALGEVATESAEAVLKACEETRNEEVSRACRSALDRLELVRATNKLQLDREKQGYEPDRSGAVKAFDRSGAGALKATSSAQVRTSPEAAAPAKPPAVDPKRISGRRPAAG